MITYTCDYVDEPLKEGLQKENGINHFSDKKLGYKSLKGATILPCKHIKEYGGGVISENGYEDDSACYTYVRNFGYAYEYDKASAEHVDETVVYVGMFAKIWGHCITDNLSLMWFLKSDYYEKYKNCKLVYIAPDGAPTENFVKLLGLIGIDAKQFVRITRPTVFTEIILPEKCFFTDGKESFSFADMRFTQEYKKLIAEITDKVPAIQDKKYDKVYFSRAHFSKADLGEVKIEKYLKKHGYTVVYPEKCTLERQIAILKRCNHFAATEGSISHNSVFLKPNTEVLLLQRAAYFTSHTFTVNPVNNLKATFVSANFSILTSKKAVTIGPYFYYVSDHLLKYFGEEARLNKPRYWVENFKDFKKYFKRWLYLGNIGERISQPYYYEKLQACLQKYYVMRKKVFPYCLLRIKYLPKRIKKLFKKKNGQINGRFR